MSESIFLVKVQLFIIQILNLASGLQTKVPRLSWIIYDLACLANTMCYFSRDKTKDNQYIPGIYFPEHREKCFVSTKIQQKRTQSALCARL